jgi:hypothetical protein
MRTFILRKVRVEVAESYYELTRVSIAQKEKLTI